MKFALRIILPDLALLLVLIGMRRRRRRWSKGSGVDPIT